MSQLQRTTDGEVNGLRAIVLENEYLRVTVLPELGGKIWQIAYKPTGSELLWHNPAVAPARQPANACYDDVWSGGWDELFPNDEAGEFAGRALPDHGELWTGAFDWEAETGAEFVALRLSYRTPVTEFLVERRLVLRAGERKFRIEYGFTNEGVRATAFLWKLHPAFAVTGQHRIDMPAMTVVREPGFEGTLGAAPMEFAWPTVPLAGGEMDLRQVPDASSGALHFFYGTGLREGWCAVTNQATGLAAGLWFDVGVLPSCWLFASHGGWQDLNVAVLEPATGYPFQLDKMVEAGRAPWLGAGESLRTLVVFAVGEGFDGVGGVTADGEILAG